VTDFDRDSWERRWEQALREHGDALTSRPANQYLRTEFADLPPGRALDAGCGHGAESIWLAGLGWQVTAVDFSVAALDRGRQTAASLGPEISERIDWVEGDLGAWTPAAGEHDLVVCLYVHVADSVGDLVRRLSSGVAPGGTLFLVGHRPIDPATGQPTPAAGQVQVSVGEALGALDPAHWEIMVAEERQRAQTGTGVDAVVRARRRDPAVSAGD
jgi:SAM-dependent methyltransferase